MFRVSGETFFVFMYKKEEVGLDGRGMTCKCCRAVICAMFELINFAVVNDISPKSLAKNLPELASTTQLTNHPPSKMFRKRKVSEFPTKHDFKCNIVNALPLFPPSLAVVSYFHFSLARKTTENKKVFFPYASPSFLSLQFSCRVMENANINQVCC